MIATLTSKGQITLPKEIRDSLKLKAGDRVDFVVLRKGRFEGIAVKQPVSALKGMVPKPRKPVSLEAMGKAVVAGARRK